MSDASALARSKLEDALRAIECAQSNVNGAYELLQPTAGVAPASWYLGLAAGVLRAARDELDSKRAPP